MMRRCGVLVAAAAVFAGGCDLLDKATAERPNDTQSDAIVDILSQAGTLATIADDPASTSEADLIDAMRMEHYIYLANPDLATAARILPTLPALPPDCITSDGNGNIAVTDCDVTLPGGRACVVNGSIVVTKGENSTTAVGTLSLGPGDPDCLEQTWDDIDITLEGPPDQPSSFTGQCEFSEEGDNNFYTGTLTLEGIAIADKCDVPSVGSMTVVLQGMYRGKVVDSTMTAEFQESPCGDIFLTTP